jgi:Holliday junction resolvase RusA-like endonuclease
MNEPVLQQSLLETPQRPNAVPRDGGSQLLRGLMVPLCPSSNRYWRIVLMCVKGTKFPLTLTSMREVYKRFRSMNVTSDQSKEYLETMKELALIKRIMFHTSKPLRMDVVVCPFSKRSLDPHNYTKVLLDVFEQVGVYEDDDQVVDLRVRLGPVIKEGRMVISLWEIEPDRDAVLKEAWG